MRDIKVRYKRSILGIVWSMLSPLLSMAALTIAFSALLKQQIANYPAYFLAGSVFWTFFAQATSHAASLTTDASEIARRVYVPRSVFVAAAVGVALVNLLYTLVPLLLIIAATGHPIHATWFFLPVSIVTGILFTAGVGLVVFTMASRFVDVKETYLVVLSTWFFLTPIVYTPAVLAPKYRLFVRLNPMTYLVEMFRAPHLRRLAARGEHARVLASRERPVAHLRLALLRLEDRGLWHPPLRLPPSRPPSRPAPAVFLDHVTLRYRIPREVVVTFKEYALRKLQGRMEHNTLVALRDVNVHGRAGASAWA